MDTKAARCPVEDFERGRLPPVCALSGLPSDGTYTETLRSPVGAQYLLLLFGVVPFLVVRFITRKQAIGKVPVTRVAFAALEEQAARRRARSWALFGGALATWILAVVVSSASSEAGVVISVVGVGLLLAGIVYDARTPLLRGHVEPSGRWVVIENAHPAFAAAVDAQLRAG